MSLPPRQRGQLQQVLAEGHLRIVIEADWRHTSDLLDLIADSLDPAEFQTVCISAVPEGDLKIRDLVSQISAQVDGAVGHLLPQTDDVTTDFKKLIQQSPNSAITLLLIEGAHDLQLAAWSYIQMACRSAPHIRVAFAGPERFAPIMLATGHDGLGSCPVTTLRLNGQEDDAELALIEALQGQSAGANPPRQPRATTTEATTSELRRPAFNPADYAPEPQMRRSRAPQLMAGALVVCLVAVSAYWQFALKPAPVANEVTAVAAESGRPGGTAPIAPAMPLPQAEPASAPATPPVVPAPEVSETRVADAEPAPPAMSVVKAATEPPPAPAVPLLVELPRQAPVTVVAEVPPAASPPLADDKPAATLAAKPGMNDVAFTDGLMRRGDTLLQSGDISGARLMYERAADGGSARAAMAMGGTFDPAVLAGLRAIGLRPDPARAVAWYRRARDLGDQTAIVRLQTLRALEVTNSGNTEKQP